MPPHRGHRARARLGYALALALDAAATSAAAQDAGPACGDGICARGETCAACPADCAPCGGGVVSACGDGVCARGESCDSCILDCGPCTLDAGTARCGDGVCARGESCTSCVSDCGPCPVCGDGTCQRNERCDTCPADCRACAGDAGAPSVDAPSTQPADAARVVTVTDASVVALDGGCTLAQTFTTTAETSVQWQAFGPQAFGTGASASIAAGFTTRGAPSGDACLVTASATGDGLVCGAVLGQEVCAPMRVDGDTQCRYALSCTHPPLATCDAASACCGQSADGVGGLGATWRQRTTFGPFACGVEVVGAARASVHATRRAGPGCALCPDETVFYGRVDFSAHGGGTCTLDALGAPVDVTVDVLACGQASSGGTAGCGGRSVDDGGASLTLALPAMTFGWFQVSACERNWEAGHGC